MVRLSECSSYRGFELSSDFYEKVLVKVQGEFKNSSSYWKFELSGVRVIGGSSYRGFELSGVRVIGGSSYRGFELSGVRVIGGSSYRGFELSGLYCTSSEENRDKN